MTLLFAWTVAFAFLLVVSASTVGYACVASRLARTSDRSVLLTLGLGLYASLSLFTGVCGGYGAQVQTLLLFLGGAALWTYRSELRRLKFERPRGADRWWLVPPLVYLLCRFVSAGLPQQHSDPLYYHLAAPKHWVELGRVLLVEAHPSFAQATIWEALYGLPMIYLGPHGETSHVVTQIYAQWMHVLWGQVGCMLVGAALLKRLAPPLRSRPGLAIFVSWLCTTQPAFEWQGVLAKNDYILYLFVLAAIVEAMEKRAVLAGILVGLAFATKVLGAWALIGIALLLPMRSMPRYAAGAFVGAAVFFFRNYFTTGNPLFPMLDDIVGPGWVSELWKGHNSSYGGSPRLDPAMLRWVWDQMFHKALPKILVGLGLIALAAGRRLDPLQKRFAAMIAVESVLALLMLRPIADGRYAGYVAMSAALFFAAAVVCQLVRSKTLWKFAAAPALALAFLINSPVDELVKVPRDYLFKPMNRYVERFHPMTDLIYWVEKNVAESDRILFFAEKQLFYLDRPYETASEMRKWEKLLEDTHSAAELFAKLRALGYRYVHFSPQAGGYPPLLRRYWKDIVGMQGKAIYRTDVSLIFDLKSLGSG